MIQKTQIKKVAIIIQRCGEFIHAGAELYALELAKSIAHCNTEVDILTSQSDDYIRWNNNLKAHESISADGKTINILRFPVKHSRMRISFGIIRRVNFKLQKYLPIIYKFFSAFLDYCFLKFQGPWCPKLWTYLKDNIHKYDLVIVKSYLYAPNYFAIMEAQKKCKTVFIVTGHNEPEFKLNFVRKMLQKADMLGFVSLAEKKLCEQIHPYSANKPYMLLPPGLQQKIESDESISNEIKFLSEKKFFFYLGRIDLHKNVDYIFKNTPKNMLIAFAGDLKINFPQNDSRFIYLGKINNKEKEILYKHAIALLMVSRLEAYSIVTAEAISHNCLVLALKGCEPVEELIQQYGGIIATENQFQNTMHELWNNNIQAKKSLQFRAEQIQIDKSYLNNAKKIIETIVN